MIFFIIFISSCAKLNKSNAYIYMPEFYFDNPLIAYDNGNIKTAINIARKNCNKLDDDSCNLLGKMYIEGRYLDKNDNKAFKLFSKGCTNKNGLSCLYLGNMYNEGLFVNINDKKRDEYYNKASNIFFESCNNNKSDSCMYLGTMYLNGSLYDPNEEGINYLKKACNMQNGKSCTVVGDYYFYKKDDKTQAFALYKMACDNHNPEGCLKLIDMYVTYKNTELDNINSIIDKSDKMCRSGASNLCVYLGNLYKRYTRVSRINKEKSFENMLNSCDFNNPYGCKLLGDMYAMGYGVDKNQGSTLRYYSKACQLGFVSACTLK